MDQTPQGAGRDDGVVVEKEKVAAARQAGGLVVGAGEAGVVGVANQDDARKSAGDHIGGAVGRGIVYDDYFQTQPLQFRRERSQTGFKELSAIPVDDADGYDRPRGAAPWRSVFVFPRRLGRAQSMARSLRRLAVCHAFAGRPRNLARSQPRKSMRPRAGHMLSRRLRRQEG